MTEMIFEWLRQNQVFLQYMGVISLITFLVTPLAVSVLILRIPEDYFLRDRDHPDQTGRDSHPVIRFFILAVKNAAGIVFLLAGLAMLVLPGQGIITILVGLTLISFPGKRSLELRIVRQKRVLSAVNWIRARARKPTLKLPPRSRRT
jgi:hypothetical protein